ncbi:MAG: YbaB/EbfC family nucleoid-associated protein [Oscillospiraceae bacterium]|nr:YbaB/EbfC family nucleoid-associated protein [Oscillospiraceae bacterium]MDY4191976.1 YbaB/EbfC family nucleoid-associated protein [Oscillospiraceae bacterium]
MKARLPQGYGGGPSNMQGMIRQAQKVQENMAKAQEELNAREFQVTVGGGAVEVTMTGKKELKALNIKPEVVDPEDVDMLQDLIMAAVNEVIRTIEDTTTKEMEKITGGLNVPGLF